KSAARLRGVAPAPGSPPRAVFARWGGCTPGGACILKKALGHRQRVHFDFRSLENPLQDLLGTHGPQPPGPQTGPLLPGWGGGALGAALGRGFCTGVSWESFERRRGRLRSESSNARSNAGNSKQDAKSRLADEPGSSSFANIQ